jgi:hypothetical protein
MSTVLFSGQARCSYVSPSITTDPPTVSTADSTVEGKRSSVGRDTSPVIVAGPLNPARLVSCVSLSACDAPQLQSHRVVSEEIVYDTAGRCHALSSGRRLDDEPEAHLRAFDADDRTLWTSVALSSWEAVQAMPEGGILITGYTTGTGYSYAIERSYTDVCGGGPKLNRPGRDAWRSTSAKSWVVDGCIREYSAPWLES